MINLLLSAGPPAVAFAVLALLLISTPVLLWLSLLLAAGGAVGAAILKFKSIRSGRFITFGPGQARAGLSWLWWLSLTCLFSAVLMAAMALLHSPA
ncbi:MAG: hypothetical protein QM750_07680 [Rubrivivax sp.]